MAHKLIVELKVVNENGEVVGDGGNVPVNDSAQLRLTQVFREFAQVDNAHVAMIKLHNAIESIRKLS